MASKVSVRRHRRGGIVRVENWTTGKRVAVRVPAGGDRSGNRPGTFYGATNFRQSL